MSETIIDAIDRVILSIVSRKEMLRLRTNSLDASCGDSLYQPLLIPDYALTWALLDWKTRAIIFGGDERTEMR